MNLSEYDYHYGSLDYLVRSGLWVEGKQENGVTTYTGFDNIDNYYEYKGKGKTVINGSNDSDSYIVSLNSKSNLYINDKGNIDGSVYDYMYINSDYKNIRALFNVDASGKVVVSADNEYSDNFMLFDKGAFNATNIRNILSGNEGKGVINIDNFFKESDSWYPKGDGNIEYIYASKNILKQCYKDGIYNDNQYMLRPSYWLEDLGQDVANWLATYGDGKYANSSAFDVLQGDNTKDINALLKVYNTVYDKNFST